MIKQRLTHQTVYLARVCVTGLSEVTFKAEHLAPITTAVNISDSLSISTVEHFTDFVYNLRK